MKFSYNWLRELVDGLDTPPRELARLITLKTAECEGVEETAGDSIIEVDNKSLTHRPDLWGHQGMAREVAAILCKKLLDPVKPRDLAGPQAIAVQIEDYSLCPRYSALVFDNVTVRPSPAWMVQRLDSVALNAINNIVDVTNFVMAELAQPMHAFDSAKLRGGIVVRSAWPGERIAALNGESYDLDASNLVIADASGAVAIAGVIGGAASAISEGATRIVLESANFNASSVRKTSARLKLRTDASMRFEKAQDPVNTIRGLERAFELLEQVSPGIRLVDGVADAYRPLPPPPPIVLPLDWLDRKLGRTIPRSEVRSILESLEFQVAETSPGVFSVTVPSWRATKDVCIKDDLVEEIGRMVGYDAIVAVAPLGPARAPYPNPTRDFHHRVREMAAAQGFTEVKNYSFVSEEMVRAFSLDPATHVEVANPIAADQNLLRRSLLPGIWKNIRDNARNLDSFRLFEIGREISPESETPHLAAAIFSKDDGVTALFELKRLAECLLPGARVRPAASSKSYEHPLRAADVLHGETALGRLFEFHPRMVESGRAAALDLNLALMERFEPPTPRYEPLRRFPSSAFDLSVVAPARSLIGDVEAELSRRAGADLLSLAFLRDFTLDDGRRSLSYRLTIGAPDRTLTSEQVNAIRSRIIDGMRQAGFELRV
jgi:phenylalanyl-tRNA synthetase beta chain